jgi:hypothetical protein
MLDKLNNSKKLKKIKQESEFEELIAEISKTLNNDLKEMKVEINEENNKSTNNENQNLDSQKNSTSKNRINLGDSLFLMVGKYGIKTFHYRITMNGNSTSGKIGTYPEMSFEEARKIADEQKEKIRKIKLKENLGALNQKIKEQRSQKKFSKIPCFRRLRDAGELYSSILDKGINSVELKAAALLTLLYPALYQNLMVATRGEYNYSKITISNDGNYIELNVPLPISNLIEQSFDAEGVTQNDWPLFPELSKMTAKERENILTRIYNMEYTSDIVTPSSLRTFFTYTLEKHGGFNKEFVDKLLANFNTKKNIEKNTATTRKTDAIRAWNTYYAEHQNAAIAWYSKQILRKEEAFELDSVKTSDMV